MGQVNLDEARDKLGGFVKGKNDTTSDKKNLTYSDPALFRIATYDALQPAGGGALDLRYTNLLRPIECIINKNETICQVTVEDPVKNRLDQYQSGEFGYLYDKVVTPRHHIVITSINPIDSTTPGSFPVYSPSGPQLAFNIDGDHVVLFAGFRDGPVNLNLGGAPGDKIQLSYRGIQEGLNDLQVKGIIAWDLIEGINKKVNSGSSEFTSFTYGHKAIFNENGLPDQMKFTGSKARFIKKESKENSKGSSYDNPYFNKAKDGPTKYWTIFEMMLYVLRWYIENNAVLSERLPQQFQIRTKFANYITNTFNLPEELKNETVNDVSIEGLGVWEAMVEIMSHCKRFDIGGGYHQNGKFQIEIYPRMDKDFNDTAIRDTKDFELTMSRGGFEDPYDPNKIVNNSEIFLNRENTVVGRVEVYGARVLVNTVFTTLNDSELGLAPFRFSTTENTFNEVGAGKLTDFSSHGGLYLVQDLVKDGLSGHTYNFDNYEWVQDRLFPAEIPVPIADLNGSSGDKAFLFDCFEVPEVMDSIQSPFSESSSNIKDMSVFVADKINKDDASIGPWIYVKPAARSKVIEANISPEERGQLKVNERNGNTGDFITLQGDAAGVLFNRIKDANNSNYVSSLIGGQPIPLIVRVSMVTHYRIVGIAEITAAKHGVNFDPTVHKTVQVADERFQMALSYKDATYDAVVTDGKLVGQGSFTAIPDGYVTLKDGGVDADRKKPLEEIQGEAEAWLDRLVGVPQNSGELELRGVQEGVRMGTFIKEIDGVAVLGGTARTLPFPTPINTIRYDFLNYTSGITLGQLDESF